MLRGRERYMGLGPIDLVSLADAREAAYASRKLLHKGIDPIEHRDAARVPESGATFKECAERLIGSMEAGWRNDKHIKQWKNTLATYAYPELGKRPVQTIDTGHVLKVLEPIWTTKPETASRVRQRVEAVLNWASARGYRSEMNPARWRGHLDHLLPAQRKVASVKHHAALPYTDIATFISELGERPGTTARALEFLILTGARTGEVIGARKSEIDHQAKLWIIPGERMKANREHRVPLSKRAVKIIEQLPKDDGEFLFANPDGKAMSNMALLALLKRMKRDDLTVHGVRSTFRDWASETTSHPSDVVEMALAHSVSDKTEAAYRRGDLLEKRRRLMEDWARYCETPARDPAKIVPIRARSAAKESG
jgi:integrase